MDDYSGYTTTTGQSLTQNFGSNIARPYLTNQNYYVEDHWKASSRLALDFGLRWEYTGAPFNYLANPATDPTNPFASFSTRVLQNPKYTNFAPRFGFAYQPFSDNKTVVRGAFGMFYDHLFTNIDDNIQASAPNAASPIVYGVKTTSVRGTPSWIEQFATLSKTPLPTNTQTTINNNMNNPLTYQYNLSIERALPGGFGLTATYAGSRSLHLYSLDTLNPVNPATSVRINSARGIITMFSDDGISNYNALELELQHNYRKAFQFRGAFTYGKALDDVSDPYTSGNLSAYPEIEYTVPGGGATRMRDYGLSAYDHRLRGVGTVIYNTPVYHWSGLKAVAAHIINNYTVSAIPSYQSGSVYNVQAGLDINNDGIQNDRPVLTNKNAPINTFSVASQTFYSAANGAAPGVYCDGSYVLNAKAGDAYCHVVQYTQMHYYIGNYGSQNATQGRDGGITPGNWNVDAAAQREFKVGSRQALSFRAESFNVLNHANTGIPSFTLYGSTLLPIAPGYSTGTFANYGSTQAGARSLRFFLRYSF